jgi:hypothetical protein
VQVNLQLNFENLLLLCLLQVKEKEFLKLPIHLHRLLQLQDHLQYLLDYLEADLLEESFLFHQIEDLYYHYFLLPHQKHQKYHLPLHYHHHLHLQMK